MIRSINPAPGEIDDQGTSPLVAQGAVRAGVDDPVLYGNNTIILNPWPL
jgi:hypothetical protein